MTPREAGTLMKATSVAVVAFWISLILTFPIMDEFSRIADLFIKTLGFTLFATPFIFASIVLIGYPLVKFAVLLNFRSAMKILVFGLSVGATTSFALLTVIFELKIPIIMQFLWGGIPGFAAGYIWWRFELQEAEIETLGNNN
ncbi:hypothetical protein [Parasphingorhabdus sp.]|uniref:hypothetical protein n=1 Tax=Parasphingorhabdus sp. TaxID=2709688 RepID=UPI003D2BC6E1